MQKSPPTENKGGNEICADLVKSGSTGRSGKAFEKLEAILVEAVFLGEHTLNGDMACGQGAVKTRGRRAGEKCVEVQGGAPCACCGFSYG